MLSLSSSALIRLLNDLHEHSNEHTRLLNTLASTRLIIGDDVYHTLVEKANNEYTATTHCMMDGIFPEAELEESFEIIDDGDADITNEDDDDNNNNNLEDQSDNEESCDYFVGVKVRDLTNKEPLFGEKNLFAEAINNNTKTPSEISIVFKIPTQRLNRYARHVKYSGLYQETHSSGEYSF
jgi:hypothetical protein